MLATRPATAQFISRKLAVRFVSDDPPQALVDRMAKTFLSSDGDIAAVLSTLFHSQEFWDTNVYRAKVKTPIEFVVSAARASNADIENMQPLANAVREMGMPLYGCVTPNGYSWNGGYVGEHQRAGESDELCVVAGGKPAAGNFDCVGSDGEREQRHGDAVRPTRLLLIRRWKSRGLRRCCVAGGVSDSTRAAVLQQFEQQRDQSRMAAAAMPVGAPERQKYRARAVTDAEKQDQVLAGLLLGSPEFQRR